VDHTYKVRCVCVGQAITDRLRVSLPRWHRPGVKTALLEDAPDGGRGTRSRGQNEPHEVPECRSDKSAGDRRLPLCPRKPLEIPVAAEPLSKGSYQRLSLRARSVCHVCTSPVGKVTGCGFVTDSKCVRANKIDVGDKTPDPRRRARRSRRSEGATSGQERPQSAAGVPSSSPARDLPGFGLVPVATLNWVEAGPHHPPCAGHGADGEVVTPQFDHPCGCLT